MPELPDVEHFRNYLETHALNKTIKEVSVPDTRILEGTTPQALGRRLKNARFTDTQRHGKFLFSGVGGGGWVVLHFGMTGSLTCYDAEEGTPEYAKTLFRLDGGKCLAYLCTRMLGRVGFADDLEAYRAEQGLGPDALAEDLDLEKFRAMVRDRRGQLKSMLMDQSFIAGLGNVYSDEVLFQAGLHPKTEAPGLSGEQVKKLYGAMRRVLRVACRHDGDAASLPNYFIGHREEGAKCPRCGGAVRSVQAAGRTAYYCPECQGRP